MPNSVWVVGTYDQPTEALFDVDLMQWLAGGGVPVAGVVFKRSAVDRNPDIPTLSEPCGDGRQCLHVRNFNDGATVSHLRALRPGLLIYAGGRDIFRRPLLDLAPLGMIGGHYGQLPQIRGMGTVEWSVMLGVPPTVAIQRISPGIDTGDILLQARVPLVAGDTFTSIRDRSYFMTKTMLVLAARRMLDGGLAGTPQAASAGRQYIDFTPRCSATPTARFDGCWPSGQATEGMDLFIPDYFSRSGLDDSRRTLQRFIEDRRLARYEQVHVFAYIVGAWTLNPLVGAGGVPKLATVISDRSPYQERAPRIAGEQLHFLTWVRYGSPVFDLARTPYPPLTAAAVKVGLVVETAPTSFIKDHAQAARSYGPFRFGCDALSLRFDDCMFVAMNHDDLYVRFAEVWPEVLSFIRNGRYSNAANRTAPIGDALAVPGRR